MFGLGTIINVAAVVVGGFIGHFAGNIISESMKATLEKVCGLCALIVGLAGTFERMFTAASDGSLSSSGTIIIIISLTLGTIIGELLHIDDGVAIFGTWLKKLAGSHSDSKFVDTFVTTSVTISIGAMAIVGSINDGVFGDPTILITKSIIDLFFVLVMTSSFGKGAIFAAIPIAILEGGMTVAAHFAGAFMSDALIGNIALVGSVMIVAVGINSIWNMKIKVANMLPGILIAAALTFIV